jgi:hypothetical protein
VEEAGSEWLKQVHVTQSPPPPPQPPQPLLPESPLESLLSELDPESPLECESLLEALLDVLPKVLLSVPELAARA